MNRREFLQFLGVSGVTLSLLDLESCSRLPSGSTLPNLGPSLEDKLITADGLNYKILMSWGDPINSTQKFGFNNDFIAYHALSEDRGILWVNHEYVHPLFIAGNERTKENIDKERLEVGGSLIEVKSGLNENDLLITEGYQNIYDGQAVKVLRK